MKGSVQILLQQRFKGFTLIELMISIAIIGILASIAVPAYNSYTYKARVSELMNRVGPAQIAIAEYVAGQAYTNAASFTATDASTIGPNVNLGTCTSGSGGSSSGYVSSLCVSAGGKILVQGTANTGPTGILYTPTIQNDGTITWACNACPSGARAKYVPTLCATEASSCP